MRTLVALAIGIICPVSALWSQAATGERVRDAASRAIALIQNSQETWSSKQACSSCHHQYQPAIAFSAARQHGIPVNEKIAHADAVRAFASTDLDRAVQYTHVIEPAMDDAYRLVAGDAAGVKPSLVTAVYARLLASRQDPAGHWESFHQRPPSSYSRFTMTALALRAIQIYSSPKADVRQNLVRARKWLLSNTARDTEERTYKLLGLAWAGTERSVLEKLAAELKATQQSDGGWNSLDGRASDAYSTGQSLVALHQAGGVPISDPAWQRGIDFLLSTQAADGSWHVASRLYPPAPVSPPYFDAGYPYGHDQFISVAGASWSVIALADALGPAPHPAGPSLAEAELNNVEPWAETVLFGSPAELKRLLDGGFDPNSATGSGGTSALMMAAPDAGKMKMLLDRGANVNARSKTKYSALMVAAQYQESTAAIRLLLSRGAEVRFPEGQEGPLFSANPVFLAAYAGNADVLPRLLGAGGKLDDAMALIGTNRTIPVIGAARLGNIKVVRALLDLGAPVDQADGNDITLLGRAVLGNQIELARLFISRGADLNHVDKLGMTPLLYAASIDFGDSAMVELLLKSGASPAARTREGLTAIDLARKYKHTHLVGILATRT